MPTWKRTLDIKELHEKGKKREITPRDYLIELRYAIEGHPLTGLSDFDKEDLQSIIDDCTIYQDELELDWDLVDVVLNELWDWGNETRTWIKTW